MQRTPVQLRHVAPLKSTRLTPSFFVHLIQSFLQLNRIRCLNIIYYGIIFVREKNMKTRIELISEDQKEEVVIKCYQITDEIQMGLV